MILDNAAAGMNEANRYNLHAISVQLMPEATYLTVDESRSVKLAVGTDGDLEGRTIQIETQLHWTATREVTLRWRRVLRPILDG